MNGGKDDGIMAALRTAWSPVPSWMRGPPGKPWTAGRFLNRRLRR